LIIHSDKVRLKQVLNNLIYNAIDFVSEITGKIEINAQTKDSEIIFYVKDNGIGIPSEKQKDLFKKFYQIDMSHSREHGGTGLGLSICKGILEGLGVRYGLKVTKYKVQHFTLLFQRRIKLKILAIDDNPDLTELLEVSLSAMGHEIKVTNDATEGLALVTSNKYDIILLDINMPKFTGIDFVNTLVEKNSIQNHNIVLFTSSSTSSSEVSELLKKGVRGCIEKPIEVDVLEKEISKFISKSQVMDSEESTKIFGKLKDDSQKELFLKFLIDFSSGKIEELEKIKQELQKDQYDKLLIVLADDVSRKIIEILTNNELSHLQISKKLKIPQTTTYRKIKKLEDLTLIKKFKVVRNLDGTEESYYTSWVSEIGIKIKDGKVSYNFEKIKLDEKIKRILE